MTESRFTPRRLPQIRQTRGWLTVFLVLSFICVSLASRGIGLYVSAHPTGPANPLDALRLIIFPGSKDDSWGPMISALQELNGPHGSEVYETLFFGLKTKFQYPPSSLLILSFINKFVSLSPFVLNTLNSVAFLMSIWGMFLLLRQTEFFDAARGRQEPWGPRSVAMTAIPVLAAVCTFYPILRAMSLGQLQVWIDCLFIWACVFFVIDRRLMAGAFVGLACTLKPQLGLFLLWAMVWREQRFAGGFLLVCIPLELAAVLRYGIHNHLAYLNVLSFISERGETIYLNQSLNGLANRLLDNGNNLVWDAHEFAPPNPWVHFATIVAAAVFILVPLAAATRARRRAAPLDLGLAALCFTLASPIAWEHHYGVTIPIYLLALCAILDHPPSIARRTRICALGISWCLIANYMPWLNMFAAGRGNILQSYVFFGALILFGILIIESAINYSQDIVERRRGQASDGDVADLPT